MAGERLRAHAAARAPPIVSARFQTWPDARNGNSGARAGAARRRAANGGARLVHACKAVDTHGARRRTIELIVGKLGLCHGCRDLHFSIDFSGCGRVVCFRAQNTRPGPCARWSRYPRRCQSSRTHAMRARRRGERAREKSKLAIRAGGKPERCALTSTAATRNSRRRQSASWRQQQARRAWPAWGPRVPALRPRPHSAPRFPWP